MTELEAPRTYTRMSGNWLTKKPAANAGFVALLSVLILALGSLFFWSDFFQSGAWMPANREAIFARHEYWRLWTALFAHADIGHLLSNSVLFFAFGYFLSGHFGWRIFPFTALFFGGLTNAIVVRSMPPTAELIGVSGVVYWMGAAWITLYYLIDLRGKHFQRILKAMGVAVVLFVPETIQPNISYRAHFVGFMLGMLWALAYYRWNKQRLRRADEFQTIVEEPFPFEVAEEA